MLQKKTVEPATLDLIIALQKLPALNSFLLVGGTALALQIGHRKSIDIDLFTNVNFSAEEILENISQYFSVNDASFEKNTLQCYIEGVKTDLLRHNYPCISPILETEGVRMAGLEDIAAMKLSAIIRNGQRLKDFIDIACLSSNMILSSMLNSFSKKYPGLNDMMAVKALTYHADIDFSATIEIVDHLFNWKAVERRLSDMIKSPNTTFAPLSFS